MKPIFTIALASLISFPVIADTNKDGAQFIQAMQEVSYIGNWIPRSSRATIIDIVVALDESLQKLESAKCSMPSWSIDLKDTLREMARIYTGQERAGYLEDLLFWEGNSAQPMIVLSVHQYASYIREKKDHNVRVLSFSTDMSGRTITSVGLESFQLRRINAGTLRKPRFVWAIDARSRESVECEIK